MQISDISTQLKLELGPGADRRLLLASLRTGQILQAIAMSANDNGRVRLRIGTSDVLAQTRLRTTVGQKLSLIVVKGGSLPELSLLQETSRADLQALALKSALPRQLPLDRVLDNLARVSNQPVVTQSPQLQEAIRRMFAGLPAPNELKSGQHLSRVFGEIGLLMESQLLRGNITSGDLKANLLRLLTQLHTLLNLPAGKAPARHKGLPGSPLPRSRPELHPSSPDQLQRSLLRELAVQTEGALARIQLNQLTSLPAGEREAQLWQFDLPLRQDDRTDVFRIRITKEEPSDTASDAPGWTLNIRFDLSPLGTIEVRLALAGATVSTHFWAEREDTRARIEQQLPQLERAFADAGLSAVRFTVHQGVPPEPPPATQGSPILDVKA